MIAAEGVDCFLEMGTWYVTICKCDIPLCTHLPYLSGASLEGGRLGGRSSAKDGRVVAVTGTSEALVAGTAEVPRTETPEALVAGTAEVPTTVTGIPEAVDMEIPISSDHVIRRVPWWPAECRCLSCKYPG